MFGNIFFRIVFFCGLLVTFAAHAAIDEFVIASKPSPASISNQVSAGSSSISNDHFRTALVVQMASVRTDAKAYFVTEGVADRGMSKSVWALACGLAFLSVMRRRLGR